MVEGMATRPAGFAIVLVCLLAPLSAHSKEPEPRRDPKGVTGVSPFWERLARADRAVLARDFDAALAFYREAIVEKPEEPLGHYRVGALHTLRGDFREAELAYQTALRLADKSPALKAKLLFLLGDLLERQGALEPAAAHYEATESLASDARAAPFVAAATERKKRVLAWLKQRAESEEIKARIAQGPPKK